MDDDASERTFWAQMQRFANDGSRLEPTRVVQIAVEAGVSPARAVALGFRYHPSRMGQFRNEGRTPLQCLVSQLVQPGARVLEFTTSELWLSLEASSRKDVRLSLISPNAEMVELLRVAAPEANILAGWPGEAPVLEHGAECDLILCAPPIGTPPKGDADEFGGEIFSELIARAAEGGRALWLTSRAVQFAPRAQRTMDALAADGWGLEAVLDVGPGAFLGSNLEGVLLSYRRGTADARLVGALRDEPTAADIVSALKTGPRRKSGSNWAWVSAAGPRSYREVERERLIATLRPKGKSTPTRLGDLLRDQETIRKADRAPVDGGASIYVPEYAESRVTATLEEQTVKANAVYCIPVDGTKVHPGFLAYLLNTPIGRELRSSIASGATIQRISVKDLRELVLPIPDFPVQEAMVRTTGDISLLAATLRDLDGSVEADWSNVRQVQEKVGRLLGVLDLNRQISEWWQELPYPLATVYRRFRVERLQKEKLEALLHFFELTAIYLADIGSSHVKQFREDWSPILGRWLHPAGSGGIERADFGFWNTLAAASLKDLKRIGSDKELREAAIERAGPQAPQSAASLGSLAPIVEVLDEARAYRNRLKGHGGHLKESDAARYVEELERLVRRLYELGSVTFRSLLLVMPGTLEATDTGLKYSIQKLAGSDPTFDTETIEVDAIAKSHALAFWLVGSRRMCPALPFMRIGAPQRPQENTCYVYNRQEAGGVRWISYQEAQEQEFTAPDEEMQTILSLGREGDG